MKDKNLCSNTLIKIKLRYFEHFIKKNVKKGRSLLIIKGKSFQVPGHERDQGKCLELP